MKNTDSFDLCIETLHQNLELLDELSCTLTEVRWRSPGLYLHETEPGIDRSDILDLTEAPAA